MSCKDKRSFDVRTYFFALLSQELVFSLPLPLLNLPDRSYLLPLIQSLFARVIITDPSQGRIERQCTADGDDGRREGSVKRWQKPALLL